MPIRHALSPVAKPPSASSPTPTTCAYRARYIGKHLKHGSFCDPVVCTVRV